MVISHATDVEARAAECTVCQLVTASLRSRWKMIIPGRLSNVIYRRETSGVFYTYFMTHMGLFVVIYCCGEVAASEAGVSDEGMVKHSLTRVF